MLAPTMGMYVNDCKPHIYGTLMCGMKEHRSGLSFYKTKQFYPHCYHYHFYHYYLFIII